MTLIQFAKSNFKKNKIGWIIALLLMLVIVGVCAQQTIYLSYNDLWDSLQTMKDYDYSWEYYRYGGLKETMNAFNSPFFDDWQNGVCIICSFLILVLVTALSFLNKNRFASVDYAKQTLFLLIVGSLSTGIILSLAYWFNSIFIILDFHGGAFISHERIYASNQFIYACLACAFYIVYIILTCSIAHIFKYVKTHIKKLVYKILIFTFIGIILTIVTLSAYFMMIFLLLMPII